MKATVDGITYEGTEDEIRRIVSDPPNRKPDSHETGIKLTPIWPGGFKRNRDGTLMLTCETVWEGQS